MRGVLASGVALALGLGTTLVQADEDWRPLRARPAPPSQPAATLGRPLAVAVPATPAYRARAVAGEGIHLVGYNADPLKGPIVLAGSQAPPGAPAPSTVTSNPGGYPTPEEQYNAGVVTEPPGGGSSFLSGFPWVQNIDFTAGGRRLFESDHAFDNFVSPVSSPFLAEDPRSLTEVRPIFLWQMVPGGNTVYGGGDIFFAGLQARVALTDRVSFVINKLGWVWNQPNNATGTFVSESGFGEIWLGPKFTFWRDDRTGTLMAAGLTFQVPSGSSKVFQDTGSLSLVPYLSFAQNLSFLPPGWGSFNFMSTTGYAFGTDNQRSDYFFSTFHLDYDLGGLRKIYPMLELTWVNYTSAGKARSLDFEGRDLFNFGSTGVGGQNDVTLAAGLRYKFNEAFQVGAAAQFPVAGRRDLADFRLTVDMIFRY